MSVPSIHEKSEQPSILVVDDTARNIQVLAAVLTAGGYKIAAASNGQQALNMIEGVAPDLILLDVMMPGMDGFEVCRKIQKSQKTYQIPVIMLTARTSQEDIVVGFKAGAVDYITKPFSSKELLARVRNHVRLKTARDTLNDQVAELKERLSQVHDLSGLLPICAHCKKIRSDEGYWEQLEVYISNHSDARFSYDICPECEPESQAFGEYGESGQNAQRTDPILSPGWGDAFQVPTVLMVDDNTRNLQVLGNVMKKNGYQVAAATNGEQAVSMVNKKAPDLVLLDIMMPKMDGLEVCRTLKSSADTNLIPVIMLTAKSDSEDIAKGFEAGAEDYVTKPFNPMELISRVNTHMEIRRIRNELDQLKQKLETTLAQVRHLSRLIPICASCSKVRADTGYWQKVEEYISSRSKAEFSHGICPDCMKKHYPDIAEQIQRSKK